MLHALPVFDLWNALFWLMLCGMEAMIGCVVVNRCVVDMLARALAVAG